MYVSIGIGAEPKQHHYFWPMQTTVTLAKHAVPLNQYSPNTAQKRNVENEGPTGSENYKFENEQRIDFKNDKFIRKQVLSNLNNMVWG